MNILNNRGSNFEPWGIPRQISDYLLYEEPALVLCFLRLIYMPLILQSINHVINSQML